MPLIDSIRRRLRTQGANPLSTGRDYGFTSRQSWQLSDDDALGLTAVYRAVNLIATTVASLPLHVFQEKKDRSDRSETLQNAYIWNRPNPEMTRQTFWETVVGHEVMGDAFIFVAKNRDEVPLELWPLEPGKVRVMRFGGTKYYEYDDGYPDSNVFKDFTAGGEIIHVPNWGRNGLHGLNPIKVATTALQMGMSAQEYAEKLFAEGSIPSGVLSSDQDISDADAELMQRRWERRHAGRARIAVLGKGTNFKPTIISPVDAQLVEQMQFSLGDVERLFGVPPVLLGDTERSTSWGTGIAEQILAFHQFTLQPHIIRFEQAINDALLRRGETKHYAKFSIDGLLRGTPLTRAQKHTLAYGRWMTVNEIRGLEDLPPVDGGDEVLAGSNLTLLEALELVQATTPAEPGNLPGIDTPMANLAKQNGHHVMNN